MLKRKKNPIDNTFFEKLLFLITAKDTQALKIRLSDALIYKSLNDRKCKDCNMFYNDCLCEECMSCDCNYCICSYLDKLEYYENVINLIADLIKKYADEDQLKFVILKINEKIDLYERSRLSSYAQKYKYLLDLLQLQPKKNPKKYVKKKKSRTRSFF